MNKLLELSSAVAAIERSFFFTTFLGVAIKKVTAPKMTDTNMVPIVFVFII